jgi:hypothetical protein
MPSLSNDGVLFLMPVSQNPIVACQSSDFLRKALNSAASAGKRRDRSASSLIVIFRWQTEGGGNCNPFTRLRQADLCVQKIDSLPALACNQRCKARWLPHLRAEDVERRVVKGDSPILG